MAEQNPCVRCNRPIDALARSCVYCGWDQSAPRPLETESAQLGPLYVPPSDHRFRYRIIATVAFVALVISAFVLGSIVRASDAAKASQAALRATAGAQEETPRSTVTLVPVEGGNAISPETPVTTAPSPHPMGAGNSDLSDDRADATALPSEAYAIAAQRVKAERDVNANKGPVDPRTIAGDVAPRPRRTIPDSQPQQAPVSDTASPTKAVPLYQPVPSISVDRPSTARLTFTVDADGHVQDITVAQSIPDEMPRLIAAVQNWRYKPATLNGQPVTSTLSVDINVHPR
jgi:TonB family protein